MNYPSTETQLNSLQLAKRLAIKTLEESTNGSVYEKIAQLNRMDCSDVKQFILIFGALDIFQKVEFMKKVRNLKKSEEKIYIMAMTLAFRGTASPIEKVAV